VPDYVLDNSPLLTMAEQRVKLNTAAMHYAGSRGDAGDGVH